MVSVAEFFYHYFLKAVFMRREMPLQRTKTIAAAFAVMFFLFAHECAGQPEPSLATAIEKILGMGPARYIGLEGHGYTSEQIDKGLSAYYHQRNFTPVWVNAKGPNERAGVLRNFLDNASEEGLNPEDYKTKWIKSKWGSADIEDLAKLEIIMTLELSHYVADIREGRKQPAKLDPVLFASAGDEEINMAELSKNALDTPDLGAFLRSQHPQHVYYTSMVTALARYRKIANNGGWPSIPAGAVLKPGVTDPRIPMVRKRLSITHDFNGTNLTSDIYDYQLAAAVKKFQERHYLSAGGVIGGSTLTAMNITVEKRIRQIIVNMERWRWLPRNMGGKQVFVNIAGFHLTAFQDETLELRMPVIVGKEQHMTPVFSGLMEYIEFNPYWNVPASIAVNEYLPQLRRNPNALAGKHIRVFSGWAEDAKEINPRKIDWRSVSEKQMAGYLLRQDPGPWNALGTVKFIFPNKYSVFLHDTPTHSLFASEKRAFSHGCIRVSRPQELAVYILNNNDESWTLDQVKSTIQKGERKVVYLKNPLRVNILYRTAVATGNGTVFFGQDIYGQDALLEKALF